MFRRIEARRFQRPLAVLDLAVPRDFESAIGDALGVYLYSLDDLEHACELNRQTRAAELPAAELVIAPDTGHMPHRLRTDLVVAAIRRVNEMTSARGAD